MSCSCYDSHSQKIDQTFKISNVLSSFNGNNICCQYMFKINVVIQTIQDFGIIEKF